MYESIKRERERESCSGNYRRRDRKCKGERSAEYFC